MKKILLKKWRGLQQNSHEEARIIFDAREIHVNSTISFSDQKEQVIYQLALHEDWTVSEMHIQVYGSAKQSFSPEDAGVKFVDFEISPLTNSLPVNFLKYHQQMHLEEEVLLIRFPSLSAQPHRQSYQLLDKEVCYRNLTSGFESDIIFDKDGFVMEYSGLFMQV
ncbi:putative glycolipid-binding domain-containing protein [Catalinimonas sp. 4WD22]|uniref:putative glycolipid-binding domain-containing protein n=1 Tax=Catalinimonas locisalis TaxID=3133978 RepID=UPI003101600E